MWEILNKIKALVLAADPKALRYFGRGEGNYTVWSEYELRNLYAGDSIRESKWSVLIERFTILQDDPVVLSMMAALAGAEGVTFRYSLRRNNDQELIYHSWDCEVC